MKGLEGVHTYCQNLAFVINAVTKYGNPHVKFVFDVKVISALANTYRNTCIYLYAFPY
jgi:hypothetical protein